MGLKVPLWAVPTSVHAVTLYHSKPENRCDVRVAQNILSFAHLVKYIVLPLWKMLTQRQSCPYQQTRNRCESRVSPKYSNLSLYLNHFIDMRTIVSLSISYRKNVFLLKFSNKNTVLPPEVDKLTVALMSIKRLNKERRPLVECLWGRGFLAPYVW